MARTLLLATVQRALAEAAEVPERRASRLVRATPEPARGPAGRRRGRRGGHGVVGAGLRELQPAQRDEAIVVVGGGLAGLVCAHRLSRQGTVRWSTRRATASAGGYGPSGASFADGQIAEHGGELIDSDHVSMRRLVAELGLSLANVIAAEKPGTGDVFHFNGARYPVRQAVADFGAVYPKLKRDLAEAGYPTLHNHHKPRGVELDHISIAEWLSDNVPGGLDSDLGRLLDVAYNTEFGADVADQTSLNLLYLLGYSGGGRLRLFGASNERFHVRGGNDQVIQRLARELEGQLTLNSELVEIKRLDDGALPADLPRRRRDQGRKAQRVVLALPFAVMRESVDYSDAGFDPVKTDGDRAAGHGHELEAQRPVLGPPLARPRRQRQHLCRHRLPVDLGGEPRPARPRRDPGRLHGRDDRQGLRRRLGRRARQAASSSSSGRCCPASPRPSTAAPSSTTGPAGRSRAAATPTTASGR